MRNISNNFNVLNLYDVTNVFNALNILNVLTSSNILKGSASSDDAIFFQPAILLDALPLAGGVVHLEVGLNDHGRVRAVVLHHVLLVLRQLNGDDIA